METQAAVGIQNAIAVLQALLDRINTGLSPMWHADPVDGNSNYLRSNVINVEAGNVAVTVHMDPSQDPAHCRMVGVQFPSYCGRLKEGS